MTARTDRRLDELRTVVGDGFETTRRALRRIPYASSQSRAVREYLTHTSDPKLHLGAGRHHLGGWLNTDRDPASGAVHLDATRRFPLADASMSRVFSEHLVEHLPYADGLTMLQECQRVLRRGGRIRVATPDLEKIVGLRDAPDDGIARRYAHWLATSYYPRRHGPAAVFAINKVFHGWGHAFLYDEETLRSTLEACGFVKVRRYPFGHSDDPSMHGLEGHGVADGNADLSAFETMVLEATRL